MTFAFIAILLAWIITLEAWYYRFLMTKQLRDSATQLSVAVSALMKYMNTTEFVLSREEMDDRGQLEIRTGYYGIRIKAHPYPEGFEMPKGHTYVESIEEGSKE